MSEKQNKNALMTKGKEVDFLEIIEILLTEKKTIILVLSIFLIFGLFVAFNSQKKFKVVTVMLPQSESETGMGSLSSLAAMAGFNIDMGGSEADISPVLYPQIVESEPFLLSLMYTQYSFGNMKKPVTLFDYYTTYTKPSILDFITQYTIGLPSLIKETFKGKTPVNIKEVSGIKQMSEKETEIAQHIKGNLALTINKKEGYLTLTSTFEEALLTAQIAKRAQELLQQTITNYKTQRAFEQLDFFQKRYNEKKKDYELAQARLSRYKDRNLFVTTAVGSSEQQRYENEYNLAFSVYSELSKQLENARIKVKRVTPAYIIIKPVMVPNEPFEPKKSMILALILILGIIVSFGYIFIKHYFHISKWWAFRKGNVAPL